MNESHVIIASCGTEGIALIADRTETLLSEEAALAVTEALVERLSTESLHKVSMGIMERLNAHLGHVSETLQ